MELLITVQEIQKVRSIVETIDDVAKIDPYISEAQQVELRDLLGLEFFYKILSVITDHRNHVEDFVPTEEAEVYQPTSEEQKYLLLLNGGNYETSQGHTIQFSGLATVLSYFSYGRFLVNDNVKHTDSGFVFKQNQFSEPIDQKTVSAKHQDARSMALSHWGDVILFLDTKKEDYPLWRMNCKPQGNKVRSSTRISSVNNRNHEYNV